MTWNSENVAWHKTQFDTREILVEAIRVQDSSTNPSVINIYPYAEVILINLTNRVKIRTEN